MHTTACALLRACLHAVPLYRGMGQVADSKLCRRISASSGRTVTRLWKGPRIVVNMNDYCGRRIFFTGAMDRRVDMLCSHLLKTGDCVIDIGANYGAISLRAAAVVGGDGQVHCFEPQPALARCIQESALINKFPHVQVHEVALSDRDGIAAFSIPGTNSGNAALGAGAGETINVRVAHAGRFLSSLRLPRVALLKIDIEGSEWTVMNAAKDWMSNIRPKAVVFESAYEDGPLNDRPVFQLLRDLGYRVFSIRQYKVFGRALKECHWTVAPASHDFVALAPGEKSGVHQNCCATAISTAGEKRYGSN